MEIKLLKVIKNRFSLYNLIIIVMLFISLSPLILISILLIHQYEYILKKETEQQLIWNTEVAKYNIESYIQNIKQYLKFVIKDYSIDDLLDENTSEVIFYKLKNYYKDFVDFGVLDSDGNQKIYVGPFQFKDKNYADTDWFNKASVKEEYISYFFYGKRNIPHFVITLNKFTKDGKKNIIVRTSIHLNTIEEILYSISSTASDDIFIIDENLTIHTKSRLFGDINQPIPLSIHPGTAMMTVNSDVFNSSSILYVVSPIKNTPWKLVLVKQGLLISKSWKKLKDELFFTVFLISVCVLVIAYFSAYTLVAKFREAEESKEKALMAAQQAGKLASIGRLASGVAHEINNPLAIIDQKAGLMQDLIDLSDSFPYKDKFEQQIKGIRDAVHRCKSITHRLLGFARRMDVNLEDIDISSVIDDVISFIDKEVLYRNIKIITDFSDDVPNILSDRGQLQQVFLNILNNAIDAIEENGEIYVKTQKKGSKFIDVIIKDTGPGIPEDVKKHIFEPFFTTKQPGKGTGLGLSITYGIVKKLGGDIKVESEDGKGAVFIVTLPVKPDTLH